MARFPLMKERWSAALSYVIIGLLMYIFDDAHKTEFVRFHTRQALVFLVLSSALFFVASVFSFLLPLWILASLVIFVFAVIGIIHSFMGVKHELPFFGKYAKDFRL